MSTSPTVPMFSIIQAYKLKTFVKHESIGIHKFQCIVLYSISQVLWALITAQVHMTIGYYCISCIGLIKYDISLSYSLPILSGQWLGQCPRDTELQSFCDAYPINNLTGTVHIQCYYWPVLHMWALIDMILKGEEESQRTISQINIW